MAFALAGFTAACDNNDDNDNGLTGSTNTQASPSPSATPNTGNGGGGNPTPAPTASPNDNNNNTGRTFTGQIQSIDYRGQNLTIDERGVVSVTNETKLKDSAGGQLELRDFRVGDTVRYDGYRAGSGQYFLTKLVLISR